ncbi:MAG: DNA modification methylase [Ignavibacterium sp.]|nr:DNA modification methylase [Ignavibacterium sp.]
MSKRKSKLSRKIIPVTCTSSHQVDVSDMKPIQGNLKSRTREQLQNLRTMILKYGFSFPMYIWFDGENHFTLDGHGRDFICKELVKEGYTFKQKDGSVNTSLPCVFIDAKNKVEAKEKLLAVNSSYGTITDEGLYSYLFEPGFELNFGEMKSTLELPGVDLIEFEQTYLSPDEAQESDREYQFIFSQEQIKQAIKDHFPKFKTVQEIVDGVIDIPLAMHQFNKLCSGTKNVGGDISLLFNPHRLETRINNRKHSAADCFINPEKGFISSISQWMSKQQDVVHHRQYIDVAKANTGTQMAHEFKPYLARDIYQDYCEEGAKVLDPCAGWGGRMMGFASSGLGGEYFATDPSVKTFQGLQKLRDFLLSASNIAKPKINLFNKPFEDLKVPTSYFDFAFTSPPYFDTEIYSDEETQAFIRYKTIGEFNKKFLTVLIQKVMKSLKANGFFVINIGGSQYRFDLVINSICEKLGLKVREIFDYKIGKGNHLIEKMQGDKLENTIKANDLFFEIRK